LDRIVSIHNLPSAKEIRMNWEMPGAMGEFFGALGVIATLRYLARQVHESTRASLQAE
jgi:hypothetical protein